MSKDRNDAHGRSAAAGHSMEGGDVPKGHPQGIWVIFIAEMWERFSYYGMRALLTLYLIASTTGKNPGFGWSEANAYTLYGVYTWLVYLTPLLGGWLADRFLGTHRSLVLGGWIIVAGHVCLALTELFGPGAAAVVTLESSPAPLLVFMSGLLLIIIGTGFFKPCSAVMVGQLYAPRDPRRDAGYTIYYMGVNAGAFLAGLVAGTLGEKVGWHWGFGSAAVGMVLGLVTYQALRPRYLRGIGLPPKRGEGVDEPKTAEDEAKRARDEHERTRPLTRVDWERIAVIVILSVLAIAFWVGFEQAGSSLNVFAAERTDRVVLGFEFPATWYQSVNSMAILIFAPMFAWLWVSLGKRGREPSTPVKFAIGLMLLGLGYVTMIFGVLEADRGDGLAGPHWLLLLYTLHTLGELCLSPVGLSMVSKLAPARHASKLMGFYYFAISLGNALAGLVAVYSIKIARGEVFTLFGGQADFFLVLFAVPFAVGLIVLALSPMLKRMMHGAQ